MSTGSNHETDQGEDPRGRLCRSHLTTHLLDDCVLSGILHDEADAEPGSRQRLALRQRLDRAIRARVTWPREQDYVQVADDMERLGWLEHAATLRDLVGTDQLISQVSEEWTGRYWTRGTTDPELDVQHKLANQITEFADAGPVPGTDGALYHRGYTDAEDGGHVILVRGRGLTEMIEFGEDETTCERWVASRGPLATGPLHPPARRDSRTWREEQLLAAMLADPAVLARYRGELPRDAFTADSRYEIYCTLLDLADAADWRYPWQAFSQITARQDHVPASELATYGGEGMPWLRIYLDRLAATSVASADVAIAARTIIGQDEGFRRGHRGRIPAELVDQPRAVPGLPPDFARPLVRPPGPGEPAGPVPRR